VDGKSNTWRSNRRLQGGKALYQSVISIAKSEREREFNSGIRSLPTCLPAGSRQVCETVCFAFPLSADDVLAMQMLSMVELHLILYPEAFYTREKNTR